MTAAAVHVDWTAQPEHACAEALFVSYLQPSDNPTPEELQAAADSMVTRYGCAGCAALVATEFGDHPDTAIRRMGWALTAEAAALRSATAGAQPGMEDYR